MVGVYSHRRQSSWPSRHGSGFVYVKLLLIHPVRISPQLSHIETQHHCVYSYLSEVHVHCKTVDMLPCCLLAYVMFFIDLSFFCVDS